VRAKQWLSVWAWWAAVRRRVFVELPQEGELLSVWLVLDHQSCGIKKQGSAREGWRLSTLVFLWAGGNAKREQGNELRLRSAVPRLHAHKATAKIKQLCSGIAVFWP